MASGSTFARLSLLFVMGATAACFFANLAAPGRGLEMEAAASSRARTGQQEKVLGAAL